MRSIPNEGRYIMLFDRYMTFASYIERIHKEIGKIKTRHMREFGLKSSDFSVMVIAARHEDGATATELAAECQVDKAVISRAVRHLQAKGYMESLEQDQPVHYRQKLKLTEKGFTTVSIIMGITEDAVSEVSRDISQGDIEEFYRTLGRISKNLDRLTGRKRIRKDTQS